MVADVNKRIFKVRENRSSWTSRLQIAGDIIFRPLSLVMLSINLVKNQRGVHRVKLRERFHLITFSYDRTQRTKKNDEWMNDNFFSINSFHSILHSMVLEGRCLLIQMKPDIFIEIGTAWSHWIEMFYCLLIQAVMWLKIVEFSFCFSICLNASQCSMDPRKMQWMNEEFLIFKLFK